MEVIGLVTAIVSLTASIVGLATTNVTMLKGFHSVRKEKNHSPNPQENDSKNQH